MTGMNAGMRRQKRDLFIDANDPTTGRICLSIERENAGPEWHAFVRSIQEQIAQFLKLSSPPDSAGATATGGAG
jgi:hypothetical protein